tara:strand:- start:134 stop:598 length:465 start_codon:yes stop_codon:yes gene_type:complete
MRKVFALLIPILFLSGCLGSDEPSEEPQKEIVMLEQHYDNQSYQFWNSHPMSIGNTSIITFNNSGDLNFTLDLMAQFHEPVLWEQGYLNYSLVYENETIWSIEVNTHPQEIYYMNVSNITGSLTVQVQASGSDSQTDEEPGDWFVAIATFDLKY